jgi:hypothetical protein
VADATEHVSSRAKKPERVAAYFREKQVCYDA